MSSFYNNINNNNQSSQHQLHHHTTSVINFPKVIVQPIQSTINLPRTNVNQTLKRPYFNSSNSDLFTTSTTNQSQSRNLDTQFSELFDFNNNELTGQTQQQQQPVYLIYDEEQSHQQQQQNNLIVLDDQQSQWLIENPSTKANKTSKPTITVTQSQQTPSKLPSSSLVVPQITNVDEIFFLLSQKIAKYCQILSDLTNCEVFYKAQLPIQSSQDSTKQPNKKYKSSNTASKRQNLQQQRSLYWGTHQMLFQFSHDQGIRFDKSAGDSLIRLNQRTISTDVNKLIEEILNAPSSDSSKDTPSSSSTSSSSSSSDQNETINLEKSDEFNLNDELNRLKEFKILNKSTAKSKEIKFKDCCVYLNKLNDAITNDDYFTKFEMKHNSLETNFMIGQDIVDESLETENKELSLNELPSDNELYSDEYTLNFNNKKNETDDDDEDDDEEDEKTLIEKNCLNNNNEINENDENYYKCEQCVGYSYKHLTQLKVHELRKHLNVTPATCQKCGLASFTSQDEFYKHSIICYFPHAYQCKQCSQLYDNYPQYLFHIRYIHTQVVYMCSICHRKYKHIKDLIDHDQLMHSKSLNYCELCYGSFKTRQLLYEHLKQSHLIIKYDTDKHQVDSEQRETEKLVNNSESTMSKRFVLTNESEEQNHDTIRNNINEDEENNDDNDDEEEQFVVKSIKNNIKPIQLISTGKVQKNELIRGIIDRKHQCKWCSLRFYTKSQLKQHEQSHTNSMLNCPVCDKQFTSKDRLNGHMKCHMEPSLECKVCGKKFKRLCNLYNHELVHGLTEHAFMLCQFCGRGFRSRRDYQNHVIANHRDHLMKVDSDGKIIEDSNENTVSLLRQTNRRQRKTTQKKVEQSSDVTITNMDSSDDTYFTRTGIHFAQDDLDEFQLNENEDDNEELNNDDEFNQRSKNKKLFKDKNKIKKFKLLNNHIEVEEDVTNSQDYNSAAVCTTSSTNTDIVNHNKNNSNHTRSAILTQLFEESFN